MKMSPTQEKGKIKGEDVVLVLGMGKAEAAL
jgi:hypothetical protein